MTKVISISDEAYEILKRMKNNNSFSEVIVKLSIERKSEGLKKFAGVLGKTEGEKIKKEIYGDRKITSRRFK